MGKGRKILDEWIYCEKCTNWRRITHPYNKKKVGDYWECKMYPYSGSCLDPTHRTETGEVTIRYYDTHKMRKGTRNSGPPPAQSNLKRSRKSLTELNKEYEQLLISYNAFGNSFIALGESYTALGESFRAFGNKLHAKTSTKHPRASTPKKHVKVQLAKKKNARSLKLPRAEVIQKLRRVVRLPEPQPDKIMDKIMHLQFNESGKELLALSASTVYKGWCEHVPSGLWLPVDFSMTLRTNESKGLEGVGYFTFKNDHILLSATGGTLHAFDMKSLKVVETYMDPPPVATFLAVFPQDHEILAIGLDDGTIDIYKSHKVTTKLSGHGGRISGLGYSRKSLVSSGADAQLCAWSLSTWEKTNSSILQAPPSGRSGPLVGDTKIEFSKDENRLLAVHERQISIYDSELKCLYSWFPEEYLFEPITTARFSYDGSRVHVGFHDGSLGVFDASRLRFRWQITCSAYLPPSIASSFVFPTAIASSQSVLNKIAVGMSDGSAFLLSDSAFGGMPGLKAQRLSDPLTTGKVLHLMYTKLTDGLLALSSDGVHKYWKWPSTEENSSSLAPLLWQPYPDAVMKNDIRRSSRIQNLGCFTIDPSELNIFSASGGMLTTFSLSTFEAYQTMPSPSPITFLASHPLHDGIIAAGFDDCSVYLYDSPLGEVESLKGHKGRISGLVFHQHLNVLVSSGADAKLCIWDLKGQLKNFTFLQATPGQSGPLSGETRVHLNTNQNRLLVDHRTQISIYDSKLKRLYSWFPSEYPAPHITSAVYSCDYSTVYVGFADGGVGLLDSMLRFRWRVPFSGYLPPNSASTMYPTVVASHPSKPDQFAIGMSDGAVYVLHLCDEERTLESDQDCSLSDPEPTGQHCNKEAARSEGQLSIWEDGPLWKYLHNKEQKIVKQFRERSVLTTNAWTDDVKLIYITGTLLEELMMNGYVDGQVIDWYMEFLKHRDKSSSSYKQTVFFSSMAWYYIRQDKHDYIKSMLNDVMQKVTEKTRFLMFPLNPTGDHWTLLAYDMNDDKWTHYNSLKHGGIDTDLPEARKYQKRVIAAMNECCPNPICIKEVVSADCPQQGSNCDCAVYVCKFMKWHIKGKMDRKTTEEVPKSIKRMRVKMIFRMISDPVHGWAGQSLA